ncbi:MAG: hypothetical protein ACRDTU_21965, partial [Micromonosporaceae bacterium]
TTEGITVRLLGGAAVALSAGAPLPEPLRRTYKDLDYVVVRRDARRWADLVEAHGYRADRGFNSLHGAHRLLHVDTSNARQLDTFVATFAMCHSIDLEKRLPADSATLAPEDLLLTKLQIFEVNDKDLVDAAALLLSHPVSDDGSPRIDRGRLVDVVGSDWGWHTTISDNIAKVAQRVPTLGLTDDESQVVSDRITAVADILASCPKTLRWRARAALGRRVPWYDLPEEVDQPG